MLVSSNASYFLLVRRSELESKLLDDLDHMVKSVGKKEDD